MPPISIRSPVGSQALNGPPLTLHIRWTQSALQLYGRKLVIEIIERRKRLAAIRTAAHLRWGFTQRSANMTATIGMRRLLHYSCSHPPIDFHFLRYPNPSDL